MRSPSMVRWRSRWSMLMGSLPVIGRNLNVGAVQSQGVLLRAQADEYLAKAVETCL